MGEKRRRYSKEECEWIIAHANMSVRDEYELFCTTFTKIPLPAFKTKRALLNCKGKTHNKYTAEEDEWLRENFPHLGIEESYTQFCEKFGSKHPLQSFRTRLYDLRLGVTEERWRTACLNNGSHPNVPIGTIVTRGRGENYIKVSKGSGGWIPLKRHIIGEVKPNQMIVHLDRNKANDNPENLRVIDLKTAARMAAYGFWNENAILTETAILCCELETAIEGAKE